MKMEVIHISYAGPEVMIIDRAGRKWRFEDHHFCGPIVLNKDGDPAENQPPQSSPFWEAVTWWYQQGKRTKQIAGSAYAEWTRPTMEKMVHVGGNHFILETSLGINPRPEWRLMMDEKPLFIPLKREFFQAFKAREKVEEYRPEGPRWNARTCRVGRPVVLSLGYGKRDRLMGRITGYSARKEPTQTEAWRKCYGDRGGLAACIQIEINDQPCGD